MNGTTTVKDVVAKMVMLIKYINLNNNDKNNSISLCDLYKNYINTKIIFKMNKKCFEDICKDIIADKYINNNIISYDYWSTY